MSIGYAEAKRCLPVQFGITEVTIATSEPFDTAWVAQIESHVRKPVKLVVANPLDVARSPPSSSRWRARCARRSRRASKARLPAEQLVELGKSNKALDANDQGVVQVVDWLWQYAFDQRASDIHLEPRREMGLIRFRIDGVLHTVYQLPPTVLAAMTSRIKLLGRMDVVEKRRPLDGRIKTRNPAGEEVEMRLSTLPTAFGEKDGDAHLRPRHGGQGFVDAGLHPHDAERWRTRQAAARHHLHRPHRQRQDHHALLDAQAPGDRRGQCSHHRGPDQMIEPSFNQTQVQPQLDFSFAEGLRALMRQDPDIIMVGEIRDLETAEMAIQASLTGHLVFSTLHTNDLASAITRLTDLGVPSYLISATVIGILASAWCAPCVRTRARCPIPP